MAKKIAAPAPSKLYACCSKPECKRLQETVNFLKLWGIDHKPKQDAKGWYFDISVPSHWSDGRSRTFAKGLSQLPKDHSVVVKPRRKRLETLAFAEEIVME